MIIPVNDFELRTTKWITFSSTFLILNSPFESQDTDAFSATGLCCSVTKAVVCWIPALCDLYQTVSVLETVPFALIWKLPVGKSVDT